MSGVVLGIIVLVPLVITPGLLNYFDVTPKAVVFLAGAALLLFIYGSGITELPTLWGRRECRWLAVILGGRLLFLTLSTTLSSQPKLSLFGGVWRVWLSHASRAHGRYRPDRLLACGPPL